MWWLWVAFLGLFSEICTGTRDGCARRHGSTLDWTRCQKNGTGSYDDFIEDLRRNEGVTKVKFARGVPTSSIGPRFGDHGVAFPVGVFGIEMGPTCDLSTIVVFPDLEKLTIKDTTKCQWNSTSFKHFRKLSVSELKITMDR